MLQNIRVAATALSAIAPTNLSGAISAKFPRTGFLSMFILVQGCVSNAGLVEYNCSSYIVIVILLGI
jgi:hypothetical protein